MIARTSPLRPAPAPALQNAFMQPIEHGCVRMADANARRIHDFSNGRRTNVTIDGRAAPVACADERRCTAASGPHGTLETPARGGALAQRERPAVPGLEGALTRLLAHELAHTVQQGSAPGVTLARRSLVVGAPGDAWERDADAQAVRVVEGLPASPGARSGAGVSRLQVRR